MRLQITLFKEKPINKTKQNKMGLQLQGCKQRKVGGSGNLIRGGAGVLNLSKVTGSLCRPVPEVIEHWCFHCSSSQLAWAAAAALNWKPLVETGAEPLLCSAGLRLKTRETERWRGSEAKPDREHACGTASGHKGRNPRHYSDVRTHKSIHVTCCNAQTFTLHMRTQG